MSTLQQKFPTLFINDIFTLFTKFHLYTVLFNKFLIFYTFLEILTLCLKFQLKTHNEN